MGSRYQSTLFASCFIQFVATLSMTFVNAFLTLFIYHDLGIPTLSEAALWSGLSAFLASSMLAIASPFWGWLTDRYGAKWMMVRVLMSHAILTALVGLAGDVQTVLVLRAIRGITGGTSIVAITAIVSASKKEERAGAVGYQHTAQLLGGMIGPIFGGLAAPVLGFRACFLISGMAIASAIPLTLLLKWPEGRGKEASRPTFRGLAGMEREFTAMFFARASLNFLGPILPVYLRSAGVREEQLTTYTGIFLGVNKLVFAVSIPITSRSVSRSRMPSLFAAQSAAVLLPGLWISMPMLLASRLGQMVLCSPVSPQLMSAATEGRGDKGVAIGVMSSAKFLGGAVSPVISSTASYLYGLSLAFGCISLVSVGAAFAAWRLVRGREGDLGGGRYEGYLPAGDAN